MILWICVLFYMFVVLISKFKHWDMSLIVDKDVKLELQVNLTFDYHIFESDQKKKS